MMSRMSCLCAVLLPLACAVAGAECLENVLANVDTQWTSYLAEGSWSVRDGLYVSDGDAPLSARLLVDVAAADLLIETEVRVTEGPRNNFGLILRAHEDGSCVAIRYYDGTDNLEYLPYAGGRPGNGVAAAGKLGFVPGRWYRMKAAALGAVVVAKCWPSDEPEPAEWILRATNRDTRPGKMGLHVHDGTRAAFRNVRVCTGEELEAIRAAIGADTSPAAPPQSLALRVDVTPFVVRGPDAAQRKIFVQVMAEETPYAVAGLLKLEAGATKATVNVEAEELELGPLTLFLPEPTSEQNLRVTYVMQDSTLEYEGSLAPARHWTFYMTPHTHYDIGFTDPQPVVIKRLAREMNDAVRFCEETADWPDESKYRWTVEVTGLMKQYIDQHSTEQVKRLMQYVRMGRIEVCGFYLNMPTELVGHEELIRCLYYAEALRGKYQIPIDTAMINDVPGYTWALPELLAEAGINRVSFRANSIRGQFLWDRQGAVERPFYWEGPEGSRVFVWYTDSYREGNFFREPGLHEDEFLKIVRRNEQAGTFVDLIQLRMGGDNLPPDLDASRNARMWNEQYVWPQVRVATNREFLADLETAYGEKAKTYRGDIPSWWADGPASSALETGMNRLNHDRLTDVEALHTLLSMIDPYWKYPSGLIGQAYDAMIHFDEHTWGASSSVSDPHGQQATSQWMWKSRLAHHAQEVIDALLQQGINALAQRLADASDYNLVVWNPLAWAQSGVVELDLAGQTLPEGPLGALDARTRAWIPVQRSEDELRAWFVARDVAPMGYACFLVGAQQPPPQPAVSDTQVLENAAYRLEFDAVTGAWLRWRDKKLDRELLDGAAGISGNQPVLETPLGGREAVSRKQPVTFERTAATNSAWEARVDGPVFSEVTTRASLPGCPAIVQHVRLYHDLPFVEIENVVTKEEVLDPEVFYFAFPFDVPRSEYRLQIADASMRPSADQLPYSCFDFYSIQQWVHVAGPDGGVVFAPLEAPVVSLGGINTYRWADSLSFDNGHVYSMALNNCWDTNFRAGQAGDLRFRYRLAAHAGRGDAALASQLAWPAFHPLRHAWLKPGPPLGPVAPVSFLSVNGDPVLVSAVKQAENGDGIVIRLIEPLGKVCTCALTIALPKTGATPQAFAASVVETPGEPVPVNDGVITVVLRPNEILTILVKP